MRNLIVGLILLLSANAFAQPVKIEGPGPNWEWQQSDKYHGQVVVITVVSRYTEKESYQVNWRLGSRLENNDFRMITVIDFIGIPRLGFIYNYARKRILKETTASNIKLKQKGTSPISYICDMKETLRDQLKADPRHRVDIIVIDRTGEVRGHFNGIMEIEQALKLIDELTEDGSR